MGALTITGVPEYVARPLLAPQWGLPPSEESCYETDFSAPRVEAEA